MERFQQLVQESLKHAKYYVFHPTDFNVASSNAHLFTLPKDADFICGDPSTGKIFWCEVKNIKGKRFYGASKGHYGRQFRRALEIDASFGTYFYIINFNEMNLIAYFNPSMLEGTTFDPLAWPELRVTYLEKSHQTIFGKTVTQSLLDLSFLSDLFVADATSESGF